MKTTTLTVRIPDDLATRLEAEVRSRRKRTGEAATKADVIREALLQYLSK